MMPPRDGAFRFKPLGQIAEIIRGVTYTKTEARAESGPGLVPLLRATNIESSLMLEGQLIYVPERFVNEAQFVQMGDIVIASSSGSLSVVGKSARVAVPWRGTFGAFCTVVRPGPGVDARYLAAFLSSDGVRRRWSKAARGTNINNLKKSDLTPTPVPLPSLDEQRHIIDILEDHLSRLDSAGVGLDTTGSRILRLQDRFIKSRLLGESELGPRIPAAIKPAGVDDGTLNDLPSGWFWQRLGDLADVVGGITKDAKRQSNPDLVEVPYLRVANVQRGRLDLAHVATIRVSPSKAAALQLLPGDVLLNEGGDRDKLARGWIWEGQIAGCIHQNHVFRARVRDAQIEAPLLSWAANTIGAPWAERNGRQSVNLASISLSRIRLMPVPVPPRQLQARLVQIINEQLSVIDRMRAGVVSAQRTSAALRRSLLGAAFSGQLTGRVSDMEIVEELAGV